MGELIPITIKQKLFEEGSLPFQQCHASTVIVLPNDNKLVAFFAGTKEGAPNTAIWLSRQKEGCWLSPKKIIDHELVAQWNPVLHYEDEIIWLFYKCGSDVQKWTRTRQISNLILRLDHRQDLRDSRLVGGDGLLDTIPVLPTSFHG